MKLVIISGRSGSGKSTALHMLEDLGFYCIDNLPAGLLPELAHQAIARAAADHGDNKIAVSIDARNTAADLSRFATLIGAMPSDVASRIIYLDANDATLLKRFSETRRKHPLSDNRVSLQEALLAESQLLDSISAMADLHIDTSQLNLHQLRQLIRDRIGVKADTGMALMFQSFGYKGNLPIDSDIVFDVRCLPNPYWQVALRSLNGLDQDVIDFLQKSNDAQRIIDDIKRYLENWLPQFQSANRSYITVSIGCTGGQHRSVYVANALHQHFKQQFDGSQIRHRELSSTAGDR